LRSAVALVAVAPGRAPVVLARTSPCTRRPRGLLGHLAVVEALRYATSAWWGPSI
jgi:hypothetical protein